MGLRGWMEKKMIRALLKKLIPKGYTTYTGGTLIVLASLTIIVKEIHDGTLDLNKMAAAAGAIGVAFTGMGLRRNQPDKDE